MTRWRWFTQSRSCIRFMAVFLPGNQLTLPNRPKRDFVLSRLTHRRPSRGALVFCGEPEPAGEGGWSQPSPASAGPIPPAWDRLLLYDGNMQLPRWRTREVPPSQEQVPLGLLSGLSAADQVLRRPPLWDDVMFPVITCPLSAPLSNHRCFQAAATHAFQTFPGAAALQCVRLMREAFFPQITSMCPRFL